MIARGSPATVWFPGTNLTVEAGAKAVLVGAGVPPSEVELPCTEAEAVASPAPPPEVELPRAKVGATTSLMQIPGSSCPTQSSGAQYHVELPHRTGSPAGGSPGPSLRTSSYA
jgi:hypothetical protein